MSRTGRAWFYQRCQLVDAGPEQRREEVVWVSAVAEDVVVRVEKAVMLKEWQSKE